MCKQWPSALDIVAYQISVLGFTVIGCQSEQCVGDVVSSLATFQDDIGFGPTERHPFVVIGIASDEEIERCALLTTKHFGLDASARPARKYWYKCMTD
jgi:hypothetical protein